METKCEGVKLIFKDEFLVEDFLKVKLPPVDLTKMAKGVLETDDINRFVPWVHNFLKIMANNESTIQFIQKISMANLFAMVKDPKFGEYLKKMLGADGI